MDEANADRREVRRIERRAIGAGGASGFLAGVCMGVVLHLGTDLLPVLGAYAGDASIVRGWVVHLLLSVVYGVVFALLVAHPLIASLLAPNGPYDYAFAGIVYAAMVLGAGALGTIAILPFVQELPWATAMGSEIPGPAVGGLVPATVFGIAHVVYGGILGFCFAFFGPTRV